MRVVMFVCLVVPFVFIGTPTYAAKKSAEAHGAVVNKCRAEFGGRGQSSAVKACIERAMKRR